MRRISIQTLKMLFVAISITFYATASTSPWLSTPSILSKGEDIYVTGGGAPGNTMITVKVFDSTTGEMLAQKEVYTKSSGTFEINVGAINTSSNIEVKTVISGKEVSSTSSFTKG